MNAPVIHHIGLSVSNIERSAAWYMGLFDLSLVADFGGPAPMKVMMTPQGQAIDLRQDPDALPGAFTQQRVGLDHVGFVCADRAELEEWLVALQSRDIVNSGLVESPFGLHVNFRDPDGIALEFFLPGATAGA